MQITRMIGGREHVFELTDTEMNRAYFEQQFRYDRMDLEDIIDQMEDWEIEADYEISRNEFQSLLDDMAVEMRRNIEKYDMSWEYARDEAIADTIYKYQKEQEAKTNDGLGSEQGVPYT